RTIRLGSSQRLELRSVVAQILIKGIAEYRPVILKAAFNAALINVAYSIKLMRIGHRQRLQHDRVHQGEDRGIRANAERERQHSRKGEAGRLAQLPYRVSKIMKKGIHSPPICKQPQTVILSEVRLSALLTISRNRR